MRLLGYTFSLALLDRCWCRARLPLTVATFGVSALVLAWLCAAAPAHSDASVSRDQVERLVRATEDQTRAIRDLTRAVERLR